MTKLDYIKKKIMSSEILDKNLTVWKFFNKKIVFTNGCFDILHLGHIDYLSKAADMGDVLIIGLNSDSSVKAIKGDKRPINNQEARSITLASLSFVSAVVLFDEETPYNLIKFVKPDFLIKGSDYKVEDIVGYDILKSYGGSVITLDFLPDYSTTSIIEKLVS